MNFFISQTDATEEKIRAACPHVTLERTDYGYGLVGYIPGHEDQNNYAAIVLRPARRNIGQGKIVADVDALIAKWNSVGA